MWTLNTHSCKHTTQRNDLAQALDFTFCLNCGVVTECAGSATRTGTDHPRLLGQTGAGTYYGKPFGSHQVRLEVDPLAGWHCTALSKQGPTVEPSVSRATDVPEGVHGPTADSVHRPLGRRSVVHESCCNSHTVDD